MIKQQKKDKRITKSRADAWENFSERTTAWVGSTSSLVIHTTLFLSAFALIFLGVDTDKVLLVLTTLVSLEAIYLSIFIQMTVNRHSDSLEDVEENIEELSEDVEEISEDVEEIQKEVGEISEEVEEISEDVEEISEDVEEIQKDVEEISEDVEEIQKDVEEISEDEDDVKIEGKSVTIEDIEKILHRAIQDIERLKKQ